MKTNNKKTEKNLFLMGIMFFSLLFVFQANSAQAFSCDSLEKIKLDKVCKYAKGGYEKAKDWAGAFAGLLSGSGESEEDWVKIKCRNIRENNNSENGGNGDNNNGNNGGGGWVKVRCKPIGAGDYEIDIDTCFGADGKFDIKCAKDLLAKAQANLRVARENNNPSKIKQSANDINKVVAALIRARDAQYEREIAPLKKKLARLERQLREAVTESERQRIQQEINNTTREIDDRRRQIDNDYGNPRPNDPCKDTYTREIQVGGCNFSDSKCAYKIYTYCSNGKLKEKSGIKYKNNPHYGGN